MNIILFVFFKLRDCGHLRITGLQAAVKLSQEAPPPGWGPKGYLQSQNLDYKRVLSSQQNLIFEIRRLHC